MISFNFLRSIFFKSVKVITEKFQDFSSFFYLLFCVQQIWIAFVAICFLQMGLLCEHGKSGFSRMFSQLVRRIKGKKVYSNIVVSHNYCKISLKSRLKWDGTFTKKISSDRKTLHKTIRPETGS